ncbi:hypothetical protein CPB84DRAFT_159072 [Gymnopilus junonius]|uniref:Uncharacterized protein n=1 Tax=Gymnopilus junonius TaxID=109634 RepID=A0A9P5TK17_GYMJU|nr:hypothetical protein CPB84DRAFT_159072 [Gymnopilus junonius]
MSLDRPFAEYEYSFTGSLNYGSQSGLMWNFALDGNGNPKLPGTNSCGGPGSRPLATVNSDGSYPYNQEFYAMASKAIIPKDPGGPFRQRIGVTVQDSLSWALIVGSLPSNYFTTPRSTASSHADAQRRLSWLSTCSYGIRIR